MENTQGTPDPEGDPDWMRPRDTSVPVASSALALEPETVEGDPIDLQGWDYRLWRR
jgi:hypothetical protein